MNKYETTPSYSYGSILYDTNTILGTFETIQYFISVPDGVNPGDNYKQEEGK